MGKDKPNANPQQPKMDRFTTTVPRRQASPDASAEKNPDSDKLAEILAAIQTSRQALEGQIGGVQAEVSLIRQDLRNVVDRVTETEGRVSELEDTVKDLKSNLQRVTAVAGRLEFRAEDAENRARRNNLRFVGFSEGIEGGRPEEFIEEWIRSWAPTGVLSSCFVVERAHRTLVRRPPVGAPPRPMIAKILNYKDRDVILRQAREKGEVSHNGQKIMIFPDYTLQVQKARKTYEAVKIKLRAMGLKYMLLFPAKLKVLHEGRSHFFTTPQSAWDWATESPNIQCNKIPPWGNATDLERESSTENTLAQEETGKRARSRRRRQRSTRERVDTSELGEHTSAGAGDLETTGREGSEMEDSNTVS